MTTIAIHGFTLNVPDNHWLTQTRSHLPDYSENIGRLAGAVESKYPGRGFIDVGADVGETAAIVRAYSRLPILCMEGSEFYYELLRENVRRLPADLEVEGVARLDATLARHPRFQTSKVLKIDEDELDECLLESTLEWVAAARPVLFWRRRDTVAVRRSLTIFDRLLAVGYRTALVFDNTGEYMQTISLDASQQLAEIADYFAGGWGICAFHDEDADLCSRFRQIELNNRRARKKTHPQALDPGVRAALEETIRRALGEAQTTELAAVRAHLQLDRNRLQLQIADLDNRLSLKDAEIQRLHSLVRESLRAEDLKSQVSELRHELDTSLALRAARSLHWILGPIRRRIGRTSNGGRP